ncbi:hypothetical protein [Streptomyces sp. NPDC001268]|uniref:hypothetical protein n=1 Tax=Streptomyces sp. NPDC001268 TaxID=3364553 RepID=UPI0036B37227
MIIVHEPEKGERETFDARSLRVSEAQIVQRITGRKWGEVRQSLDQDDPEAMRAIAWVVKKRSHPSLSYDDFDPGIEELYTRLDTDEVRGWVERGLAVAGMDPEATQDNIRAVMLAQLPPIAADPEHAERIIEELVADPKAGAAESPTAQNTDPPSETQTSPSSDSSASSASATS